MDHNGSMDSYGYGFMMFHTHFNLTKDERSGSVSFSEAMTLPDQRRASTAGVKGRGFWMFLAWRVYHWFWKIEMAN